MNNQPLKMVYSSFFAALIFVGTQFLQVPLPFGYFNLGDCFVLLSTQLIGGPYAIIASAIGSALADILSGHTIYTPATLIIKSLMALAMIAISRPGSSKNHQAKIIKIIAGAIAAELIMMSGYFTYDVIIYHFSGAVAALPGNIIQGVVSVIAGFLLIKLMEHLKLRQRT